MIAILTCVNDRRNISPLIFECYKRLKDVEDLALIVGYSSGADGEMVKEWMSEDSGVHGVGPLPNVSGSKWNSVLQYAYGSVSNYDGFIIMGDDNSMSDVYFINLVTEWRCGSAYHGTNLNGYVDMNYKKSMKHEYPYPNKLIGAGRFISRKAIEKVCHRVEVSMHNLINTPEARHEPNSFAMVSNATADYLSGYGWASRTGKQVFIPLWLPTLKSSLDLNSEFNLVMNGITPTGFNDGRIHVLDVKSYAIGGKLQNIWPFDILEQKCKPATFEECTWFLNEREMEILKSL